MSSRISPHLTIYVLMLFYIMLAGLAMFVLMELDNYSFKYLIGFLEILAFAVITFNINKTYFQRINLAQPTITRLKSTLISGILIGIVMSVIIYYPYRIYATVRTGAPEYMIFAFTTENFIKALGAGMFEEITFRGTVLNFYHQKNMKYPGLIISSVIFCLIHISNAFAGMDISLLYLSEMLLFGFLFGLIYLNFGIVAAVTCHTVGNLLISGFVQPTRYGLYYILGIVLILCFWLFMRDKRKAGAHQASRITAI